MPSISTMLYPAPGYVRVETNWADVTQATGVKVERVDCETGERVPLRPYVSYRGDYLTLSCGYAIFWDTEPQLDRCVYYCATAIDASGNVVTTVADYLAFDDFNRVNVDTWNTATSGQAWALSGGTVGGNYDVTGTKGTQTNDTANVLRQATLDVGKTGHGVLVATSIDAVATGASATSWILLNGASPFFFYLAMITFNTAGNVSLSIGKQQGGTLTISAVSGTLGTYAAGTEWTIRAEALGSQIRAKAWPTISPEPGDWTLVDSDLALTDQGNLVTLRSRRETGNTNAPLIFSFDNLSVYDPCADLVTVEQCSDDLIVPSNAEFRLGDPVRPCNDVTLQLSGGMDPACVPTQGIFFANMSTDESYPAQSGVFMPTNSRYPIVVNRARQATVATLTTVTRTFDDRDALRALNDPGSPLFLRGPAQYGIDDRYMAIGDVVERRPVSDHRVSPRAVGMPHAEVARPSGPSQGVCGTRVNDLCDIYPTWADIEAAGLTWADLLRGNASNDTPIPASVELTWNDVNATYADWTAVNSGNTDWDDLRDGA